MRLASEPPSLKPAPVHNVGLGRGANPPSSPPPMLQRGGSQGIKQESEESGT